MEIVTIPSVEVFKTNVQHEWQAAAMLRTLHHRFPKCRINFDLMDCDKILRVEGKIPSPDAVISLVRSGGYECQVLE